MLHVILRKPAWKARGYKSCLPLFTEPYWILLGPYWVLTGSFWVLLHQGPENWRHVWQAVPLFLIKQPNSNQVGSWHWPGNQDGDKKCVRMVLVGTSDTDEVASPTVQRVNFHIVDAENNISRLKQNKSPWLACSVIVIEKWKIDGKSHEK